MYVKDECTELTTSGTRSVIAGEAVISGDCRSFRRAVSEQLESEINRIAKNVAAAHGCSAEVEYLRVFIPTLNDPQLTREVAHIADGTFGEGALNPNATPGAGSEDFAQLLQLVPDCYVNIGNGDTEPLPNPGYDFNDEALPYEVAFFVTVARSRLPLLSHAQE